MVKRILRERDMLFIFIGSDIDWHNNAAERAVRPSVVLRKMTRRSNSEAGAKIHPPSLIEVNRQHADPIADGSPPRSPKKFLYKRIIEHIGMNFKLSV